MLRAEIKRLAAREAKKSQRPMRRLQKQLKTLKLLTRSHQRTLVGVERRMARLKTTAVALRGATSGDAGPSVSPEDVRQLRSRLQMTRVEFAKQLGVSPGSIFGWETGRTVPRGANATKVLDVARLGTAEARVLSKRPAVRARRGRRRS